MEIRPKIGMREFRFLKRSYTRGTELCKFSISPCRSSIKSLTRFSRSSEKQMIRVLSQKREYGK